MKITIPRLLLISVFVPTWFASVLFVGDRAMATQDTSDVSAVRASIELGTEYLLNQMNSNGMFTYRVNMDLSVVVQSKYNILRHAGAAYALSMSYEHTRDARVVDVMRSASRYLRDSAAESLQYEPWLRAVWSDPEVNHSGSKLQAKLGGSGLGLVALVSMERIEPGFTERAELAAIGRFIVSMQKPDGSFYSKYLPSGVGRDDSWSSLFYPGEAALGLVMLYELDGDALWLKSATRALAYLAASRKGQAEAPTDHWALLATVRLLAASKRIELSVSREALVAHAVQICSAIIESQELDPRRPKLYGCFNRDGKTTPTATRLEGLLAALAFLPADHPMRSRIDVAVRAGVSFLVRAQIQDGEHAGGMPRAVVFREPDAAGATGFNKRATEIRIDYVQHSLSAFIQYLDYLDDDED